MNMIKAPNYPKVKVSVIIPVYNGGFYEHQEDFLHICLDSVTGQTLQDIEVICVYRTDKTSLPILREYVERDSRIRILMQTSKGMSAARNEGLRVASGRYVAFLDSDDFYLSPEALERLYEAGVQNKSSIVGGFLQWAHMRDGILVKQEKNPLNRSFCENVSNGCYLHYSDCQYDFMFYCYLYDREFLQSSKIIFPENLTAGEDNLFHATAMYRAKSFYVVPVEFYCWRVGHQIRAQGSMPEKYLMRHTRDDLESTTELLRFSRNHRLAWLHWMNAQRINNRRQILSSLQKHDMAVLRLLIDAEELLDYELLLEAEREPPPLAVLRPMGFDRYQPLARRFGCYLYPMQCLFHDYKRGYQIALPFRKLCGGFRCLREHGLGYTVRRALQKAGAILKSRSRTNNGGDDLE